MAVSTFRILLAGLVAGILFNAGGLTAAWLLQVGESFAKFGVEASPASGMLHLGLRFGLGFVTTGLLLMSAGHRASMTGTTVLVGLAVWFCVYVPGSFVLDQIGFYSGSMLWTSLAWGVLECTLAAFAAAFMLRGRAHNRD